MNENQIGIMEHAIRNQNRFYAEADNKDWNDLVAKGYATKRGGWEDSMSYFCPTSEGKAALSELAVK